MNNSNYIYLHRSPFTRGKISNKSYSELSAAITDISFVSSGRPSTDRTITSFDSQETNIDPRLSNSSDTEGRLSFGSPFSGSRSSDVNSSFGVFSSSSLESGNFSWSGSQNVDEVDAEMRRLKQELKQTMEMYSSACKEAFTAKQKVKCRSFED